MFPALYFHYPPSRTALGQPVQDVILTEAGAAHYSEVHSAPGLTMGLRVGILLQAEGEFHVYNGQRQYLGRVKNKLQAAEELVRLYVRQTLAN